MESLKRIDPPKAIVTGYMIIAYTERSFSHAGVSWVPWINSSEAEYNIITLGRFVASINMITRQGYTILYSNCKWQH